MSLKNRRERRSTRRFDGDYSDGHYTGYGGTFGKRRRSRIAGPIIIACAIIAVLVAADYLVNSGRVYRGVEVGNVSLGGKTPEEARRIVEDRVVGDLKEIEFTGPLGQKDTFTARQMGVAFEVQSTVDKAYAVGREGNVVERLADRGRALVGGITIAPEVQYEQGTARKQVERLANRVNEKPTEAGMEIQGSVAEVSDSEEGYRLDVDGTTRAVGVAVDDMTGDPRMVGRVLEPKVSTQEAESAAERVQTATSGELAFTAKGDRWTLSPADVGRTLDVARRDGTIEVSLNKDRMNEALTGVYDDIEADPAEAEYDFAANGDVIVNESQTGQSIEYDRLLEDIQSNIFGGQREYELPLVTSKPQYTTEELQAQKPTELQGTYRTNYTATTDQGAERVANLKIASGAVSGVFVAPGETFSMVQQVQDLSYEDAHVIIDSEEQVAAGGGLCQVTSTLYNAVLYAGLPVIERTPHDSQLPYIRPGMDATVWYGDTSTTVDDLDMKFKNTTEGYVLLQEYVADDGYIYANVYGVPNNVEVEMSTKKVRMTEDASEWVTYYEKMKDGEVVYKDKWNTEYSALYDDKGKKIPTPIVPISEVNGTYNGIDFSTLQ
ncbi:MAG: peptidoglycan binding domain-containing protein [Rubrobacteraceae bacterium]